MQWRTSGSWLDRKCLLVDLKIRPRMWVPVPCFKPFMKVISFAKELAILLAAVFPLRGYHSTRPLIVQLNDLVLFAHSSSQVDITASAIYGNDPPCDTVQSWRVRGRYFSTPSPHGVGCVRAARHCGPLSQCREVRRYQIDRTPSSMAVMCAVLLCCILLQL